MTTEISVMYGSEKVKDSIIRQHKTQFVYITTVLILNRIRIVNPYHGSGS